MVVEAQQSLGQLTGLNEVVDRSGTTVLIASPGHHLGTAPQSALLHGLAEALDPSLRRGLVPTVHMGDTTPPGTCEMIDE